MLIRRNEIFERRPSRRPPDRRCCSTGGRAWRRASDEHQRRQRDADGHRRDHRPSHAVERVHAQLFERDRGHIVHHEDNGADQVREDPAEAAERIEKVQQKATACDQKQDREGENGIPEDIVRLGKLEVAPLPFLPNREADHILECSEGTDGRAVDATEENGEDHDHDESGRAESRCVHELQQRGNELQVQQSPGDGWCNDVPEIKKQKRDQREEQNRHAHAKRF